MVIAAQQFASAQLASLPLLDRRLGRVLFESGVLSADDFNRVLAAQQEHGEQFSDVALRLGVVTERDVRRALAKQCELPAALTDNAVSRRLSVAHQPNSARAEALRNLRCELMLRWFTRGRVALAIGEMRRNQGAAVLAANLAWSFAQLGRRTLLIDANLRRPEQQQLFKFASKCGLVDFLAGRCNLADTMHTVPGFDQLSVMFAGAPPDNPQELLSLDSFGFMLEAAADAFDAVFVVGAPLLETADMQIIAARTSGCVVTAQRHRTRIADLERTQAYFQPAGSVLVGLVLEG